MVLLMIAVTWPLWFSGGYRSIYPAVPLLDLGNSAPIWGSSALVVSLMVFLITSIFSKSVGSKNEVRWPWWFVAGSLLISFLVDQHRIQPWAYQTAIYAVVLAALPGDRARPLLIVITSSLYIYSALGKFDFQFVHTVGQDFLNALTSPIGGLPESWDPSRRAAVALLFPAGELAIGVGVLIPTTRRLAAPAAMMMHAMLVAMLGPWCLDHSTGVLVWNAALFVQAYLLIIQPGTPGSERAVAPHTSGGGAFFAPLAWCLVVMVLVAPLTERHGYWDHWTSWALYAPHNSRADIEIHESAIASLPAELKSFFDADADGDRWRALNIGRWSLNARRVPVYPQARYQIALASELATRFDLSDTIRVRQRSLADRWTGRRVEQRYLGASELRRSLNQFWWVDVDNEASEW